ncbi:MAG: M23 family metallopeptidase, partial [Rhodospirillaceae bacterium]|nr:M23 family metallopeptidase [Rhodospirillaceae bacterium]
MIFFLDASSRKAAVAALLAVMLGPAAAVAGGPRFVLPLACVPGLDCAVQNYVDEDPGPAAADYTCGLLTYDGHKGTDIRLPDLAALDRNVAVLAAADGVVLRVRDSMPDISIRDPAAPPLNGRDAGNSVIIDHGDGWQTQYGHMHRGSVRVRPGQRVEAGQPIGTVGLSGNTEFPHLHFEVRHGGRTVDPFTGPLEAPGCGRVAAPLWTAEAAAALAYRPTGLLTAGFAAEPPTTAAILAGAYDGVSAVSADAPVIVFWASLYGVRAGDIQTARLLGPDGAVLAEATRTIPESKAAWQTWIGRRRKAGPWP